MQECLRERGSFDLPRKSVSTEGVCVGGGEYLSVSHVKGKRLLEDDSLRVVARHQNVGRGADPHHSPTHPAPPRGMQVVSGSL